MKKSIAIAALAGLALSSCAAGPHQLRRSVDDFDQQLYIDNPLLDGVLWFIPVIPLGYYIASIGDFLIVDAYHFWGKDVWRGEGTSFDHWTPEGSPARVNSLLNGGPFLFEAE
ncbi:hypothetical protein [Engelhardtia mirabilis]|uniref:Lipoprotein n=1 Tax=Engelhardtia mirabilis TaxID=2528011 RepID=A0A518BFR6_9BACT|nr:hypothetical protein Pla133_08870 [Planctomycetes bacterium Pla133]QDV00147.1 hypothetical protein Pla86_08860 [Planctomycetes bacterium Pla86]